MASPKLRVLLAEAGSEEAAQALRSLYPDQGSECEITEVSSTSTLFPSVSVMQPDVILLDLSLGRPDPLAVVRRLRQCAPRVPLLVFAEPADRDLAALSLAEGAYDYFLKGHLDAYTLDRALRLALGTPRPVGPELDSTTDPLTGLYNRQGFLERAAYHLLAAERRGGTAVLLGAAVEGLDEISRSFGSAEVQNALRETGNLLARIFRRTDLIGRVEEEDFAVLALDAAEPSARVLRQRIEQRLRIRNEAPERRYPLRLQLGIEFWSPRDGRTLSELIAATSAQLRPATTEGKP